MGGTNITSSGKSYNKRWWRKFYATGSKRKACRADGGCLCQVPEARSRKPRICGRCGSVMRGPYKLESIGSYGCEYLRARTARMIKLAVPLVYQIIIDLQSESGIHFGQFDRLRDARDKAVNMANGPLGRSAMYRVIGSDNKVRFDNDKILSLADAVLPLRKSFIIPERKPKALVGKNNRVSPR